jgi:hypothetical protein
VAKHRGRYVVRTDGEWIGYVECSDGTVRKASKEIGYNFTLDLEKKGPANHGCDSAGK